MIYGLSQPAWMTPVVSHRLRNLTGIVNEYTYGIGQPYLPELIRLRGGAARLSYRKPVNCIAELQDQCSAPSWI